MMVVDVVGAVTTCATDDEVSFLPKIEFGMV